MSESVKPGRSIPSWAQRDDQGKMFAHLGGSHRDHNQLKVTLTLKVIKEPQRST
jgi:hypothetical protein